MNYTKRATRGFIIVFIMNISSAFIAYLYRILMARSLTVSEYGLFFSIYTLFNFLIIFREFGLGQALVKLIPEWQIKKKNDLIKTGIISYFIISLSLAIIFSGILLILNKFLSIYFFKDPLSIQLIPLFCVLFIVSFLWLFLRNFFQGFQKMSLFSSIYFIQNSIILIGLFFFLHIEKSSYFVVFIFILSYVLSSILFLPFMFKTFNFFKYKLNFSEFSFKRFFNLGTYLTMSTIGIVIILYIDTILLTYFRTLKEVGVYNVLIPTTMFLNFIAISLVQVIFPMMSEMWEKHETNYLKEGLLFIHKYFFVLVFPISLTIFSFPKIIINLLFGEKYISGAIPLQILIIAVFFIALGNINISVFNAIGKPRIGTRILLLGAAVNFFLNLVFIPLWGITGAATTSLISYLLIFLLSNRELKKIIKLQSSKKIWIKTFILGIFFVLIIYIIKEILNISPILEAIISISIAGGIYLFIAKYIKLINIKELKEFIFNN